MADAWGDIDGVLKRMNSGELPLGEVIVTRASPTFSYVNRAAVIVFGGPAQPKEEVVYVALANDADGKPCDGENRYTIHYAPGDEPPCNAFWSITMYDLPGRLLVANPINRYLLNTPMEDKWVKDADGGLTFNIQNESPGKDKEANWLPAPKGPFYMVMRLYLPKPAAQDGQWKAPLPVKVT